MALAAGPIINVWTDLEQNRGAGPIINVWTDLEQNRGAGPVVEFLTDMGFVKLPKGKQIERDVSTQGLDAAHFAPGGLSADTKGRAVLASGFFDQATATDKFAAGAIPADKVRQDAVPHTTNYQLLASDVGKRHTNGGASGPTILTLPNPATMVVGGAPIRVACLVAQDFKVINFDNTTILYLGSVKQTAAGGFARALKPDNTTVAVGAMMTIWWMGSGVWFAEVTGDWKVDG